MNVLVIGAGVVGLAAARALAQRGHEVIVAEKADHHPKWTNVWNTVEIWLSTHDAGNTVTEKDRTLAQQIDALL